MVQHNTGLISTMLFPLPFWLFQNDLNTFPQSVLGRLLPLHMKITQNMDATPIIPEQTSNCLHHILIMTHKVEHDRIKAMFSSVSSCRVSIFSKETV